MYKLQNEQTYEQYKDSTKKSKVGSSKMQKRKDTKKVWPFQSTQKGVHTTSSWVPVISEWESCTMSEALDVLQMKENVLTIFAARTHSGDINLDFPVGQYIYQRKKDGIYIIILRRMWEELMPLLPLLPLKMSLLYERQASNLIH